LDHHPGQVSDQRAEHVECGPVGGDGSGVVLLGGAGFDL
jgi:hypothetical protein